MTAVIPFDKSFASHEKAKFWASTNICNPEDVHLTSSYKGIFICSICNHEFTALIRNITYNDQWCSYCYGDKLCLNEDCKICYDKSIASLEQAKYWSSLNKCNPRFIRKGTHKSFLFNCNICGHLFDVIISRIESEKAWCKYCKNKLCDDIDCTICYNNSFASHPLAKFWSHENNILPRSVRKCSVKKYIFVCDKCNHSFSSVLNNISRGGAWCPYCSKAKNLLCDKDNCIQCYNNSFASFKLINMSWSSKNVKSPRSIFKKSDKKYIFVCTICTYEFEKRLLALSYGSGCPKCVNKTEKRLYDWLIKKYGSSVIYNPRYDWCKNEKTNCYLPFDFEYKNIIIELDGPQHFKQVSNWRDPNTQRIFDKYKMKCALENNKHIIRILQKDVLTNKNEWDIKLENKINELLNIHVPTIEYIGIEAILFD